MPSPDYQHPEEPDDQLTSHPEWSAAMPNIEPRFPDVHVKLSGQDSNTGSIMGRITQALARAGHGERADEFRAEIFGAGSYAEALNICMRWVAVS